MSSEKELKQRISDLEDEVRAARTTIKSLTKTLEQLSKNVGGGDVHIHRNDRYVYPNTFTPYWWDGRTWYYQSPTYTLTSGGTDSTYTFTVNDDDDPDTGITVSNVS